MWTPKQNHETYQTDSTTERTNCVEFDFQYKDVTSLNPAMTVFFENPNFEVGDTMLPWNICTELGSGWVQLWEETYLT